MTKEQFIAVFILFGVQIVVWFQLNGQLVWKWFRDNPFYLALLGVPISLLLIQTTKIGFPAFGDQIWPIRLLGFATGMISFPIITYLMLGEGLTMRTTISILLSMVIMFLQFK